MNKLHGLYYRPWLAVYCRIGQGFDERLIACHSQGGDLKNTTLILDKLTLKLEALIRE